MQGWGLGEEGGSGGKRGSGAMESRRAGRLEGGGGVSRKRRGVDGEMQGRGREVKFTVLPVGQSKTSPSRRPSLCGVAVKFTVLPVGQSAHGWE